MEPWLSLFLPLLNNLSVFIVLVAGYGFLNEHLRDRLGLQRQAVMGVFFGLVAVTAMHVKIPVTAGVIVDQRNAVVALSGVFGGPVAALISASFAGFYRLYLGGAGAIAGFSGVCLAAGAGIFLYFFRRGRESAAWVAGGSLVATVIILPGFLLVGDVSDGWRLLQRVALPYGMAIFVGLFFSALLMLREDRHQRDAAEKRLNEARFKQLFDNAEFAIWSGDFSRLYLALQNYRRQGVTDLRRLLEEDRSKVRELGACVTVNYVNQATLRLYGADDGAHFIHSRGFVLGPNKVGDFIDAVCAIWEGNRNFRMETTHQTLNGDMRTVILSMPIPDTEAGFRDLPISILDITDRKRAEIARDRALALAEKANKAKSEFLAIMSHELRTPLNAILGFSEILSLNLPTPTDPEKTREYARDIHASGQLLLELVNDLLDISSIEAGARVLKFEPLSLAETIRSTIALVASRAEESNIRLIGDMPADLCEIHADRRAIKQILLNLLSNAIKFTQPGGCVTVLAAVSGSEAEITVRDTGKGIAREIQDDILEPFVRGEKDPHKTQDGWGLGLTITKALAEMHGGTLAIHSEAGQGTTVVIRFPKSAVIPLPRLNAAGH